MLWNYLKFLLVFVVLLMLFHDGSGQNAGWELEATAYETKITDTDVKNVHAVQGWHRGLHGEWKQPRGNAHYWLKIPASTLPDSGVISFSPQSAIGIFAISGKDTTEFLIGLSTPMHKLPLRGSPDVFPLSLIPKEVGELVFRISPFSQLPYPIRIKYMTPGEFREYQQRGFLHQKWYYLFVGAGVLALLFLTAFALVQFAENRKRAYLFYAFYLLCMALYFGKVLEYHYETPVFWGFFYEGFGIAEVVSLMTSYVMYILFARSFLDLKDRGIGLEAFSMGWMILCASLAIIGLLHSIFHIDLDIFFQVYTVVRLIMPVLVLYYLWRIWRARLPFGKYILLGTSFLLLGGLAALGMTFSVKNAAQWPVQPLFFMLCGVLLEALAFALGLGRQTRQMELDKISMQQQLIAQLEQDAKLERDLRASQAQTLRAQMNPHFIFNALNSVQHFIIGEDKDTAIRYLSRISQLIRRILQNSTESHVVLDEEIRMLTDYVEVEQMRFHPAFTFTCTVDPELDTEMLRIPHMMIQPFLENAILHGLVSKKEAGILKLELLARGEDAVEVIISDNGIGREEATRIVAQSQRKHQSISTSSIESRIRLLLPEVEKPVIYTDLENADGSAAGTSVRIIVPVINH